MIMNKPEEYDMHEELIDIVCKKMSTIRNDGSIIEKKISDIDIEQWEWPQGVGLFGMYLNYKRCKKKEIFDWIINWYENNFEKGLPPRNINTTAPMLTLAYIAEETGNKKYMDMCLDWMKWVMEELPRTQNGGFQHICIGRENKDQLWDDSLFMTVLFLAKMASFTGDKKLVEEVEYQFLIHIRYLFDTETGLWFHGWTFEGNHNYAKARWARGNCWVTAAIPIVLEILPDMSETVKRYLVNVLECQIKALCKYQSPSGMWHTLIDDETSYEETSATSGFAFGILKAVHMGIIDAKYESAARKALEAIISKIDADGSVMGVSIGTPMGQTLEFYKEIKQYTMAYGQALTILALNEGEF